MTFDTRRSTERTGDFLFKLLILVFIYIHQTISAPPLIKYFRVSCKFNLNIKKTTGLSGYQCFPAFVIGGSFLLKFLQTEIFHLF